METRSPPVSPGPARCAAFRLKLWLSARILPLQLARNPSLAAMLELAEPGANRRRDMAMPADRIVRAVRRTLRHPVFLRKRPCLREGLLAYRFLAEAGYRPRLHFGVDPGIVASPRAVAHCWVTLDGATVIGESRIAFVEILSYPPPRDSSEK